jgi:hypothetical protein
MPTHRRSAVSITNPLKPVSRESFVSYPAKECLMFSYDPLQSQLSGAFTGGNPFGSQTFGQANPFQNPHSINPHSMMGFQHPLMASGIMQQHPLLGAAIQQQNPWVYAALQNPLLTGTVQHPLLAAGIGQQNPGLLQMLMSQYGAGGNVGSPWQQPGITSQPAPWQNLQSMAGFQHPLLAAAALQQPAFQYPLTAYGILQQHPMLAAGLQQQNPLLYAALQNPLLSAATGQQNPLLAHMAQYGQGPGAQGFGGQIAPQSWVGQGGLFGGQQMPGRGIY